MPGESASKLQREAAWGNYSQPAFESSSFFAAVCITPAGRILRFNRAFLEIVGYSSAAELASRSFRDDLLVDASDWIHWERAAAGQQITGQEVTLRGSGDRSIALRGDIWPVAEAHSDAPCLIGAFVDISESKLFRQAVQRAARSEALGSLASGMIHDFKNLLTVLIGNLYLIAEGVRDRPELFEQARRARDVAKRGTELTQGVLDVARESSVSAQTLDPKRMLSNLKPMLDHAVGSRIQLELSIADKVSPVQASTAQLESVVLNLVINSRDAISQSGRISISLGEIVLEGDTAIGLGLQPGKFVRLCVEDNGAGIPEPVRARVFEPFYSTKAEGQGTGLGLTMVQWFAEGAGGAVRLESEPGCGTKVTLLMPAAPDLPDLSPSMTMPLSSLPGGSESVLVVAMDRSIAETLRDSLVVLGYSVHVTQQRSEIARLLSRAQFDLTVIDSSADTSATPRRLAAAIRQRFPAVRTIVVMSSNSRERDGPEHAPALIKPFTLKDLAVLVRFVLDGDDHG